MNEVDSSIDPSIDPLHVSNSSPFAAVRSATTFKVLRGQLLEEIEVQVRKLRIPIVVFALFLFCMKFIPIWVFLLCLFFAGDALFPYLPPRWKNQINEWILNIRSKTGCDTKVLKNIREAARAFKPFLMTALFFAAAPIAVIWMVLHYVGRLLNDPEFRNRLVLE